MADVAQTDQETEEYDLGLDTSTLYTVIDRDKVFGLNLTVPEDAKEVIKTWNDRDSVDKWVDSGVDDQLIIHVPFIESVKVRSVLLKPARGETCPQRLRIYANQPSGVDFADAENIKPHLDMSILEGDTGVTEYPLKVAAFTNVSSLTLFFATHPFPIWQSESASEECTRIYFIGFKGDTRRTKKDTRTKLDLAAANAADATVTKLAEKAGPSQTTIR
ncbi:PITH domain-containing protein [Cantharellus anzutake]|uniref:PITH domain-containing protein n=1 Tax=Cantharellus anzutake TaxID=1750568 RepID=UPI0019064D7A|nr:PITH domain-containing protein [Cantharellus anzutake]KAF8342759.1 PITH domain-containing protein [Cantharellus anzutake]